MKELKGKHVLIDGAGRGIGLEVARQLNGLGARVTLIDMSEDDLRQAGAVLIEGLYTCKLFDLSKLDQIGGLVKEIVTENGPLDGFVHCVGVRCRRPINILTPDVLQQVMSINYISFMEIVRNAVKKGNYNQGLSVVAISSISAKTGGPGVSGYAATKAAIEGSIRCLARELAPKGVRLNAIQPGQTHTPAYDETIGNAHDPVLDRQYLGLAESSDVANAVLFLLSEDSRKISGASIPLDCGFYTS